MHYTNLKYIKSASINAIKVDENLFDLVVNIQEVPSSFSMEFSGDKTASSPLTLKGSISESNLLGWGNSLELSALASIKQQQLSLQYVQPNVNTLGHSLTTALAFSKQAKDNPETLSYHSDSFSLVSDYSIPLTKYISASLGAGYLYNHYYEIDRASTIVRDYFAKLGRGRD